MTLRYFVMSPLVFLMLKLLGNGIKRLYLDKVNFLLLNIPLVFLLFPSFGGSLFAAGLKLCFFSVKINNYLILAIL